MVKYFLDGRSLVPDLADQEIRSLVKWEADHGFPIDVNMEEAAKIAKDDYGLNAYAYYGEDVTLENIKRLVASGYPVIIPAAGQLLGNPNFSGAGPPYHMLVITGFDKDDFITNDPGTRKGEDYKYSFATIDNVIHDWTGTKETITDGQRAMLVLTK